MEIRHLALVLPVAGLIGWEAWRRIRQGRRKVARQHGAIGSVRVYGMDSNMRSVDLGVASYTRGLELLENCLANAGIHFEDAGDAMAATHISFERDEDHFISVDAITEMLTTVRAGVGVTDDGREEVAEITSSEEVRALVKAYFDRPRDFERYWEKLPGRKPS